MDNVVDLTFSDSETDNKVDISSDGNNTITDLIANSNVLDNEKPRKKHLDVLSRYFGYKSFRPMQWKIISSIINNRSDNCAIMAAGYGKSLCYQFPSVFCGRVTVVISPLISLMEDEVLSLSVSNIPACLLGTELKRLHEALGQIMDNKYRVVYMTREFCCGSLGQDFLKEMDSKLLITLVVVDEAHCVSAWGHDFRRQYHELGCLRTTLPLVPILAVTSSTTQKVHKDIIKFLKLRNPQILCSGFDRPNLYFSVYLKSRSRILPDLKKHMIHNGTSYEFPGSTIIYCITRKQMDEIAEILKAQGLICETYHADLTVSYRKKIHEDFVYDKISVIVTTIAFGIEINKPDVRNVIHYWTTRDIESYYQEISRAGRDGQPSQCILYYNSDDFKILQNILDFGYTSERTKRQKDAMAKLMLKYLKTKHCRRQFILNHFEGRAINKDRKENCCDNCTKRLTRSASCEYLGVDSDGLYDMTQDAHKYLSSVLVMNSKFESDTYISFLRGSKSSKIHAKLQKHPLYGSGNDKNDDWWKCIGDILERDKYLKTMNTGAGHLSYTTVRLTPKGDRFVDDLMIHPNSTVFEVAPSPEMLKLLKVVKSKEFPAPVKVKEESEAVCDEVQDNNSFIQTNTNLIPLTSEKKLQNESHNKQDKNKQKLYEMLLTKRTELARRLECMPYMIASNEILMKIAEKRPTSLDELKNLQLDGLTEAKMGKFGSELIKTVQLVCNRVSEKNLMSIFDVLMRNSLPGVKHTSAVKNTYMFFKNGYSIEDIANRRNISTSTVILHLIDCIKLGYPVRLSTFGVTSKSKKIIETNIRKLSIGSEMPKLIPVKEQCPESTTFDQIKAVMAYLLVRDHLSRLGYRYVEFEDINNKSLDADDDQEDIIDLLHDSDDDFEDNKQLNALVDAVEKDEYDILKTVKAEPPNPAAKKIKRSPQDSP